MGGLLSSLGKNFVQVLYLRLSHMFYQRKSGENRQGSVLSWKVKKMGPVDRHKLVQSWSSCRYTHTQSNILGTVSPQPPQERRSGMEIHGYSFISVSTSACNKGKRLVNCLAKLSHSFCGTN